MSFTEISVQLKKKKKVKVEDVMGNGVTNKTSVSAVVDTPAPSSEDSDSDREKVCTSASVHSELLRFVLMI